MSDRLARLCKLRDQLTAWLDEGAADRAPLALRLTTVLEQIAEIEALAPDVKGTTLDELANRRAKPASGSGRTARSK